jgi:hypothetical protein
MKSRNLISIFLVTIVTISAFSSSLLSISDYTQSEGDLNGELDLDAIKIDNNLINEMIPPEEAAYYKEMEFDTNISLDLSTTGYEQTVVKDVVETTSNYYFTGYVENMTDDRHELFVARTNKAGGAATIRYWRNPENILSVDNSSCGLAIDVNEETDQVYVGGYYANGSSTEPNYIASGAGIVVCWNTNTWALNWTRFVFLENNLTDPSDTWASFYDFGGERVEDVMVMPDGNLTITGAYTYKGASYDGITTFAAKVNVSDNGASDIWFYNYEYNGPQSGGTYNAPNYGKKIVFRESTNTIYILSEMRNGDNSHNYAINPLVTALNYMATSDFNRFSTNAFLDAYRAPYVGNTPHFSPWSEAYTHYYDIALDPVDTNLWLSGVTHLGGTYTPIIVKMDSGANVLAQYNLPITNRSADFINIDQNKTIYLSGRMWDNVSTNTGIWTGTYDMDDTMFEIFSITKPTGLNSSILSCVAFDSANHQVELIGYGWNIAGDEYFGNIQPVIDASAVNYEILTALPSISNTVSITLSWSKNHPDVRYFYIYKSLSTLNSYPGDFIGLNPIAILDKQYSYTDTSAKTDTVTYHYTLICGNDNGNSTHYERTETQYYTPPGTPTGVASSTIIVKPSNVILSWTPVANVSYDVFVSRTQFLSTSLVNMTPFVKNLTVTNVQHNPNALGKWYYMINAVNSTRGNASSGIIEIEVQEIAKKPSALSATVMSSMDGTVSLLWTFVPGCDYIVYGKLGGPFDFSTDKTQYSKIALVIGQGNYRYTATNLPSGLWYFAIWSINSTGNATAYSPNAFATIKRIPLQPPIRFTTKNPHSNKHVGLAWDAVADATSYHLYRLYSSTGTDAINNVGNLTAIYNGTGLFHNDSSDKVDGFYIYCVIAKGVNGFRQPDSSDITKFIVASVKVSDTGDTASSLVTGLIVAGSIFGVVIIGFFIYKKKHPWADL